MPWVRIDDGFARHPKIAAVGPLGMAMQVAGLCYCNRELTDGFIPRSVAATLIHWETEDPDDGGYNAIGVLVDRGNLGGDASPAFQVDWTHVADLMVKHGVWEQVPGGYRIHDYSDYQPSKEQVLREREQGAKRQAEWRSRHRNDDRNAVTTPVSNAPRNGPVTDAPYPYPYPETNSPTGELVSSGAKAPKPKRKSRLSAEWKPSETNTAYAKEQGFSDAEISRQAELFRDHWLANGETKDDWDATWRNWIRRAPEFERSRSKVVSINGRSHSAKPDFVEIARDLRAKEQKDPWD